MSQVGKRWTFGVVPAHWCCPPAAAQMPSGPFALAGSDLIGGPSKVVAGAPSEARKAPRVPLMKDPLKF